MVHEIMAAAIAVAIYGLFCALAHYIDKACGLSDFRYYGLIGLGLLVAAVAGFGIASLFGLA